LLKVIKQGGAVCSEDVVYISDLPAPPVRIDGDGEPDQEEEQQLPTIDPEYIRMQEERALQDAQMRADAVAQQMIAEAQHQREQILQQAQQEGIQLRQQAMQDGYEAAYREMSGKIDDAMKQMELLLDQMQTQQQEFIEHYQNDLKVLAVDIAEKVLNKRIGENAQEMVELVRQAVSTIRGADWISVEVSDQLQGLVELLNQELPALAKGTRIDVVTKDGPPGTCVVNTPEMVLDASVSVQLENLRGVLGEMD
jgi:flagellar assembly protein FliH